jgi:antitoxin ParD1/3/4
MGKHETITADVSAEMASVIHEAVDSGDYDSVTDVVRHALSEWRIAERTPKIASGELKAMLEDGSSGPGIPMDEVFDELEASLDALILQQEQRG